MKCLLEESLRFLSLLTVMGLIDRPNMRDYWTTGELEMPKIREIMSRDRFFEMWRNLKFTDADEDQETGGVGDPKSDHYDPLFHVRPILDPLLHNFAQFSQPELNLTLRVGTHRRLVGLPTGGLYMCRT